MVRTRRIFVSIIVASFISVTALAQSKLHFDLDYQYSLGLSENFAEYTYNRGSYKMGGNLLQVAARYDVATQWSVGIGMGLARYTEPDFNTYPVFATLYNRENETSIFSKRNEQKLHFFAPISLPQKHRLNAN